jgi:hypothetical protein
VAALPERVQTACRAGKLCGGVDVIPGADKFFVVLSQSNLEAASGFANVVDEMAVRERVMHSLKGKIQRTFRFVTKMLATWGRGSACQPDRAKMRPLP